jgi:archaeal flagellar protein FlaJ
MKKRIIKKIASYFPILHSELLTARINMTPEEFVKKNLKGSLTMGGFIILIMIVLSKNIPPLFNFALYGSPFIFAGVFMYFMQYPKVMILKRRKDINREIVFLGRFLIIELESGISLYDSMLNAVPNYPKVGPYFREIITKVDLGISMEEAINDSIVYSPSDDLRRILWQILNSLKTGADIHHSINSVVEQIVREQVIQVRAYAKKLNPLAMFYMMIAIIVPTLGTTMLAVISNFIAIEISLPMLLVISFALAFVQMMFLNIIKSQRPPVDF